MSCENYNPIAAAAAAPHIGASVPYQSALRGPSCWCCEIGAVYVGFGSPPSPPGEIIIIPEPKPDPEF